MGDLFGLISFFVAVIGTSVSIYQAAVLNESKKRKMEFQYLLAGINHLALQKQTAWNNQLTTLTPEEATTQLEKARTVLRARDDFAEIAQLTVALEGTINTESSAIGDMMNRSIEMVKKNNELQTEGLKNPTLNPARPQERPQAEAQAQAGE